MRSSLHKTASLLLFISLLFAGSCKRKVPKPVTLQEAVDNIVNPYVVLGADVGIIVGIIKDGEKIIYSYGETEPGSREKISAQSVLEIASLTKTYTALALADMHLKGELNLDDPIEQYLPGSVNVPSYNGTKITLKHLANHTSGLPAFPDNMNKDAYNPYKGYTEQDMYDFLNNYALAREPGSEEKYSNTGYGILGQILSLKDNSDYETMITNRVLKPLGMTHTSVSFTPDQLNHLVHGHNGNKTVESWSQYQQNVMQGGGSLISSMDDQLLFLEANLGLKPTPLYQAMLLTHTCTFNHTGTFSRGNALGWTNYTLEGRDIVWKNGGNGGYSSFMGFDPSAKTGVVILVNSSLNPEVFATVSGFEILKALHKF